MHRFLLALALLVTRPAAAEPSEPTPQAADGSSSLAIQSGYLAGLSIGAIALLWSLPPDSSQWYDKPELTPSGLFERWRKNVSEGPVWDGDMRVFNGYGHIHAGASYTVLCLETGGSEVGCTLYANAASLLWEFGPEAIVELPSWQDILMTGLVGARVGLQFYEWRRSIARSGGTLLGSRVAGATVGFLLDPFGSMTRGLQRLFHAEPPPVTSTLSILPAGRTGTEWSINTSLILRW